MTDLSHLAGPAFLVLVVVYLFVRCGPLAGSSVSCFAGLVTTSYSFSPATPDDLVPLLRLVGTSLSFAGFAVIAFFSVRMWFRHRCVQRIEAWATPYGLLVRRLAVPGAWTFLRLLRRLTPAQEEVLVTLLADADPSVGPVLSVDDYLRCIRLAQAL